MPFVVVLRTNRSTHRATAALRSLKSARSLTAFIALMLVSIATMRLRALWGDDVRHANVQSWSMLALSHA